MNEKITPNAFEHGEVAAAPGGDLVPGYPATTGPFSTVRRRMAAYRMLRSIPDNADVTLWAAARPRLHLQLRPPLLLQLLLLPHLPQRQRPHLTKGMWRGCSYRRRSF